MRSARTAASLLLLGVFAAMAAEPARAPILVELFTSEGCSSCPPADHLLELIDPHAIVLSEHVDYWDQQGWKDPYSSHAYTIRQQSYARQFGIDGPYTPEMVIDGAVEFNGSDGPRASAELGKAQQHQKASIHLERIESGVQVDVADAPRSASVFLVFADPEDASQVKAGENNGKRLHHVAVVRSLKKIGSVKHGQPFHKLIEVPKADASRRIVVFLQDSDVGAVSGAAELQ